MLLIASHRAVPQLTYEELLRLCCKLQARSVHEREAYSVRLQVSSPYKVVNGPGSARRMIESPASNSTASLAVSSARHQLSLRVPSRPSTALASYAVPLTTRRPSSLTIYFGLCACKVEFALRQFPSRPRAPNVRQSRSLLSAARPVCGERVRRERSPPQEPSTALLRNAFTRARS